MNLKLEKEIDLIKSLSIDELCKKFKCKPEEICIGDYIASRTNDKVCPYKVILGFANFENSKVEDLGKLEIVYGKKLPERDINNNAIFLGLYVSNSKIKNLGKVKKVYGSVNLNDKIKDLGNLEFLGKSFYTNKTKLKTLGDKLKEIDGSLNIENGCLESTGKLKKVDKIYIDSSAFKDLGEIESFKEIEIRFAYRKDVDKCETLETLKNLIKIEKYFKSEKKDVNIDCYSAHSAKVLTKFVKEDIVFNILDQEYSIEFLEEKYKILKDKDQEYLQKQKETISKDYNKIKEFNNDFDLTFDEYYTRYLKEIIRIGINKELRTITANISKDKNKSIKFIDALQESIIIKAQKKLNKLGLKISDDLTDTEYLKQMLISELDLKINEAKRNIEKINKKDPYYMNYLNLIKSVKRDYQLVDGVYKRVEKNNFQDDLNQ